MAKKAGVVDAMSHAQYLNKAKALYDVAAKAMGSGIAQSYKSMMQQNAQYVLKDPAQVKALPKQWFFTHMAQYVATRADRRCVLLRRALTQRNDRIRHASVAAHARPQDAQALGQVLGRVRAVEAQHLEYAAAHDL